MSDTQRHFKHTYERPPLIPGTSMRGHFMDLARVREQCRANELAAKPGYRSARVTRAYTPQEVAQRKGISEARLKHIASKGVRGLPLRVRHSDEMPPAGEALEAVYDSNDKFLYVRSQLSIGDGGSGDYVHAEQQKGNLLYMSMLFTLPDDDCADPENFPSELKEISFVDVPHEPHAEVLIAHSRTDSSSPFKRFSFCSRIDQADSLSSSNRKMSSDPATAPATNNNNNNATAPSSSAGDAANQSDNNKRSSAPKSATISTEEVMRIIDENRRLKQETAQAAALKEELSGYQQRHLETMKPRLERISKYLETDTSLAEPQRNLVSAMVQEVSADHKTAAIAEWLDNVITSHSKAQSELARFHEERQQQQSSSAELADLMRQSAPQSSSAAAAPPLVAAHAANQPRSSGLADRLRRIMEEEVPMPSAKRVAKSND